MTKRHFEQIAEMYRMMQPEATSENAALRQWKTVVEEFASRGAQWNPRFDRARFLKACGYTH